MSVPIVPVLGKLRWEDSEFKASLGYEQDSLKTKRPQGPLIISRSRGSSHLGTCYILLGMLGTEPVA